MTWTFEDDGRLTVLRKRSRAGELSDDERAELRVLRQREHEEVARKHEAMRAMTADEQAKHEAQVVRAKSCLRMLAKMPVDEDIEVAKGRLENWLAEHEGRWVR